MLRALERETGRPIGILADLQGPKLRVGTFADGAVTLFDGQRPFASTSIRRPATIGARACLIRKSSPRWCRARELLLDDGKLRVVVERCGGGFRRDPGRGRREALRPQGRERSRRRAAASVALTAKDRARSRPSRWSSVPTGSPCRSCSGRRTSPRRGELIGGSRAIVAKLEKPAAVERLDEIVDPVGRGDGGARRSRRRTAARAACPRSRSDRARLPPRRASR